MPEDAFLTVGEVFERKWQETPHSFAGFVCEICGEMTVEPFGRIFGEKRVCIPCREKAGKEV